MAKKKPNITKILLCEDIESLGWLGDVVEVKMGYARNYLLPQGLAKAASEINIKAISDERDHRAEQRKSERIKLEESVTAILAAGAAGEGAEAVVAAKANEQGHLFGSVTGKEIAGNLREQGFAVPDSAVQMASHIKEVGTHEVTLKFAEGLSCQVRVVVVAETPVPGAESPTLESGAESPTLGAGQGEAEGDGNPDSRS